MPVTKASLPLATEKAKLWDLLRLEKEFLRCAPCDGCQLLLPVSTGISQASVVTVSPASLRLIIQNIGWMCPSLFVLC